MKRALVTGGRNYHDVRVIHQVLASFSPDFIYVGDCPTGADAHTRAWCEANKVKYKVFVADWEKHGKSAGPRRNKAMVDAATPDTLVLSFPGGGGTNHCSGYAQFDKRLTVLRIQRVSNY